MRELKQLEGKKQVIRIKQVAVREPVREPLTDEQKEGKSSKNLKNESGSKSKARAFIVGKVQAKPQVFMKFQDNEEKPAYLRTQKSRRQLLEQQPAESKPVAIPQILVINSKFLAMDSYPSSPTNEARMEVRSDSAAFTKTSEVHSSDNIIENEDGSPVHPWSSPMSNGETEDQRIDGIPEEFPTESKREDPEFDPEPNSWEEESPDFTQTTIRLPRKTWFETNLPSIDYDDSSLSPYFQARDASRKRLDAIMAGPSSAKSVRKFYDDALLTNNRHQATFARVNPNQVIVQPECMLARGTMCVTEFWTDRQRNEVVKKMGNTATCFSFDDRSKKIMSNETLFRPEKLRLQRAAEDRRHLVSSNYEKEKNVKNNQRLPSLRARNHPGVRMTIPGNGQSQTERESLERTKSAKGGSNGNSPTGVIDSPKSPHRIKFLLSISERLDEESQVMLKPVSYTHLTLPTIYSV
eukprot:TRINITY_DN9045_c0_g2_i2.p1 TRINITY_DN9045_c0_g2~~TRINITY_DN9045_c0_g2_i2.p1  ORF type:complete len:466 (-),score=66.63 TRINITY_DN9045_c0_g2_i2:34-1431(-)